MLFPLLILLLAILLAYRPAAAPLPPTTPLYQESCTQWSNCVDGTQTRSCIDSYNNRIQYTQACSVATAYSTYGQTLCVPSWQCGYWSDCTIIGQRFRNCNDGCGNVKTEMEYCAPCTIKCEEWSRCIDGYQWRGCSDTWCGGFFSNEEKRKCC